MGRYISLSASETDEIIGALYDMIEQMSGEELDHADYLKIEESVTSMVEYLNDGTM